MILSKDCGWFQSCNWTADSEQVKTWNTNSISVKVIKKSCIESFGISDLPSENSFRGSFFSEMKKTIVQAYEILTNSVDMVFYGSFRAIVIKSGEESSLPVKLKLYGMPLMHLMTNSDVVKKKLNKISKTEGFYFSIPIIEICKLYSDQNFTQDIAFLALEENKSVLRDLLIRFMNKSISQFKSEVGDLCVHFIKSLEEKSQNSYINISDECRNFTMSIMSKCVFGYDLDQDKIVKISIAINKLMYFFMQRDLGKKVEDMKEYCYYAKQISDEILMSLENDSLENNSIIKSLEEKGFNYKQISVMVIMILGSAADNLSEFLSYLLMQLALNLPIQKKMLVDKELTKKIINESSKIFNAGFVFKRHLEEDSIMMIKNKETKEIFPYYMQAGEKVICMPNLLSSCQYKFEQPFLFDLESFQECKDEDVHIYTFGCDENFECDENMCLINKLNLAIAESLVSKFSELNYFIKVNFFEPIPIWGSCTTKLEKDLYGKVVKELEFYDF